MSTLAEFASLSLTELTAEIAAMQKTFTSTAAPVLPLVAHPSERAAVDTLLPAPAGLSRDAAPDPSPLARAGAGDPLVETHA
jgi:hypothetical protein